MTEFLVGAALQNFHGVATVQYEAHVLQFFERSLQASRNAH
ncbi:MAG: hypothetical protein U1F68_07500 [Gammaproteobacteria bacterium]